MSTPAVIILGIESSCDETAAAIVCDGKVLANVIAGQKVHECYGGVVPEFASRAHQTNIVPVVNEAVQKSGINKKEISAVAFTRGPGLLGSLLVGASFAKSFALALGIPLIEVNHVQAHILAHFIKASDRQAVPEFPFLCLTVSGGHTQLVLVKDYFEMTVVGTTIDDAAGEAFDKAAKVLGLPYPGGQVIDRLAAQGNPQAFCFPEPKVPGFDFSFSGLKTSFLYFVKDELKKNSGFIEERKNDLCASIQHAIVSCLMKKLTSASRKFNTRYIALAGGVSANSELRRKFAEAGSENKWHVFIPEFEYCTDNAAMIAITGYLKYLKQDFTNQKITALPVFNL